MGKFKDRIAIVTGGGSGLGQAICRRLAAEDAKIVVADINLEGAEKTVAMLAEEGHEGFAVVCDVTNEASVQDMVKAVKAKYGKVDILVNNAGMCIEARSAMRLCDTDEATWDKSVALNLKSVFLMSKHVIPEMIENGKGGIVNIASISGYFPSFSASYSACKAGVMALTKSIAMQYIDDNIRCNCVCPGPMKTPTGINANKIGTVYNDQPRLRMIDRVADPMEMANAVCFLLSDEASYITATEIKVDGGSMAVSVKIPPRVKQEEK